MIKTKPIKDILILSDPIIPVLEIFVRFVTSHKFKFKLLQKLFIGKLKSIIVIRVSILILNKDHCNSGWRQGLGECDNT